MSCSTGCLQPKSRRCSAVWSVLFGIALAGCSSGAPSQLPVFPVHGVVVYKDQPVAGASVMFYAEGAAVPSSGQSNSKGEYRLSTYGNDDGAPAGKHRVTVTLPPKPSDLAEASPSEPPKAIANLEGPEYEAKMKAIVNTPPANSPKAANGLPAKYASMIATTLIVEVQKQPDNTINLELKD
ncbi:MAG: carboxypeptidase-like regulatory domain-containing protein [Planctomycetaceae bacterium]